MAKQKNIDLFIIGGGINGAAIARDSVGRGLSVMLAEKGDYASATSSSSSKLIHGGLRYLEQYKFSLVRESLRERETMMNIAPHLVTPLRFHIPILAHHSRPAWFIRIGLFLYDLLSGHQKLSASGSLNAREMAHIPHVRKETLKAVLHYPDCQVDDARLTLSILLDARERGADIANYREVIKIEQQDNGYKVKYKENNKLHSIFARFVVNAAGPWVNDLVGKTQPKPKQSGLRLVRGSHIVLNMPKPAHVGAHTLQNSDGRVVFTIPWLDGHFLIIGTTDVPQENEYEKPECSQEEMDYLLDIYNRTFTHPGGLAGKDDIVWTWSGVRSLADDGSRDPSKVTRSARILSTKNGSGGLISVYGGKLTTHRRLAEKVMKKLLRLGAQLGPSWTSQEPLHGGDLSRDELLALAQLGPENIDIETRKRWVFTYGSLAKILFEKKQDKKIGSIYKSELQFAQDYEDARTGEDFLFRRTKLGLFLKKPDQNAIIKYFKNPT